MTLFQKFIKVLALFTTFCSILFLLSYKYLKSDSNECSVLKTIEKPKIVIKEVLKYVVPSPQQIVPTDNPFDLVFSSRRKTLSVYDDDRYFGFEFSKKQYLPYLIPPILHLEWKSEMLPNFAKDTLEAWRRLHPHWEIMLWTDEKLDEFARDVLNADFLSVYNSFSEVIKKADMMRYVILYHYGGVYADIDEMPDKSFDPLRKHSCIIAREPEPYFVSLNFNNSLLASIHVMMCRPKHPFWLHILQQVKVSKETGVLTRTGPLMMTASLRTYSQIKRYVDFSDSVFVAPSLYFYPPPHQKGDEVHLNLLFDVCKHAKVGVIKSYKDKICQLYVSNNQIDWSDVYNSKRFYKKTFGHHLMYHSWSGYPDIDVKSHFHIKSVIPNYLSYQSTHDNFHSVPIHDAFENEEKILSKYTNLV